MKPRIDYGKAAPGTCAAMDALDQYLQACDLEKSLVMLVQLRASQLNGCAYCLDMHWKDLRAIGEQEQRLYSLPAWRGCPYYTDRERAALAWTEAVTLVASDHVPDAVYREVEPHFSEKELADLTLAVAAINAWNRLSIAGRLVPGTYQPATRSRERGGALPLPRAEISRRKEAAMITPTFGFVLEYVKDIDAARRFYVETLGLKMERCHPTFVQFSHVAIGNDESMTGTQDPELYWLVDDAEAAFAELREKADVCLSLKHMPYGKVFGIRNADGRPCYLLELARDRPSRPVE